ncbi:hypothetical protein, partial [Microseira wollei]|uniref:hypothetical protein n=1 Tax=Microseira wollei TaxID=467598 RepID=UPI001CFE18D5
RDAYPTRVMGEVYYTCPITLVGWASETPIPQELWERSIILVQKLLWGGQARRLSHKSYGRGLLYLSNNSCGVGI